MRKRWLTKTMKKVLFALRDNAKLRKVKKQDFIQCYVQDVEDRNGEVLDFIPITVLQSDRNVVDGGPRR